MEGVSEATSNWWAFRGASDAEGQRAAPATTMDWELVRMEDQDLGSPSHSGKVSGSGGTLVGGDILAPDAGAQLSDANLASDVLSDAFDGCEEFGAPEVSGAQVQAQRVIQYETEFWNAQRPSGGVCYLIHVVWWRDWSDFTGFTLQGKHAVILKVSLTFS